MTEGETLLRPLIPAISFLDILLPPVLILASLVLHTIYNDPIPKHLRAHVYRAKTAHARYLPAEARHIFSYPVLFFGVDLDALESGRLDMGRLFSYLPSKWCLTALRPNSYLDPSVEAPKASIKKKLLVHLEKHGVERAKAARIYTATMPAYMGLEGINPLTTHYCYSEKEEGRKLESVVLEVHNTFEERHLYVLSVGVDEDSMVAVGFEHQWTFPRAFHVSPFNDRTGFYRVSISDPLRTTSPTSDFPTSPYLNTRIILLTPDHEKKIYASLAGIGMPLTPGTLVSSLLRWPLSLLLTTPRILYQAMKLHYAKRLDVFPRPEPFTLNGKNGIVNPVAAGGKEGAVGWQNPGSVDLYAKAKVLSFLERSLEEIRSRGKKRTISVQLIPADKTQRPVTLPSSATGTPSDQLAETLIVTFLTPLFYSDLLASPTLPLALEVGSQVEKRWSTSNDDLFLETFTPSPSPRPSLLTSLTERLRRSQLSWGLSFAKSTPLLPPHFPPHPLDDGSIKMLWTLALYFFFIRLGYWIFVCTGARFVKGTETWGEYARWAARQQGEGDTAEDSGKIKFGSVLRPP